MDGCVRVKSGNRGQSAVGSRRTGPSFSPLYAVPEKKLKPTGRWEKCLGTLVRSPLYPPSEEETFFIKQLPEFCSRLKLPASQRCERVGEDEGEEEEEEEEWLACKIFLRKSCIAMSTFHGRVGAESKASAHVLATSEHSSVVSAMTTTSWKSTGSMAVHVW